MTLFEYQVKDREGKDITGSREAEDLKSLITFLREQGYLILRVEEAKGKKGIFALQSGRRGLKEKKKRIKLVDLVVFSRQMATMIDAGIPLVQSLDILSEQMENVNFRKIIKQVEGEVSSGKSFSESLSQHVKIFSPLFINMVKAGETSGSLNEILDRLATYLEKISILQKKIKSALIYPAVVTSLALLITIAMLTIVIPKFAEIFSQLNARLPTPTLILINVSNFVKDHIIYLLILSVVLFILFRMVISTKAGRLRFDNFKIHIPVFGSLILKSIISKFSRTLATLVKSGVAILTALEICANTAGNKVISNVVMGVRDSIREGETIAAPLSKSSVFPPMVVRMIAVGEETGELDKMLAKIADFYDVEIDTAVEGLSSLIEPLIIAFLGIVIGTIVICMFLPILTLTQAIK